ncbi:MAG TPA: acyloxyacyl hydrolase [Candidatus Sulfotelmatobacter sp.]|nr:acyloxyacyl hydrolase [Candidatus Sulfotelmatobacter sp.]
MPNPSCIVTMRREALPSSGHSTMRPLLISTLLILMAVFAHAQSGPEEGGNEIQVWMGGGHSVPGGTKDTSAFNAGLRYGWILTGPHLPSILRGRFEYALDAVPVFLVFQPANTAYGVGFDPLGLKWNFVRHRNISPYLELTGGVLFTDHNVPTNTNSVNFMDQAALGMHLLRPRYNMSLEVRYMHISNAGLGNLNPGVNTVQVRLGIGKFLHHK